MSDKEDMATETEVRVWIERQSLPLGRLLTMLPQARFEKLEREISEVRETLMKWLAMAEKKRWT